MCCCVEFQPVPPNCLGQPTPTQPFCAARDASREKSSRSRREPSSNFAGDGRIKVGAGELAHFAGECQLFGGVVEIHGRLWSLRRRAPLRYCTKRSPAGRAALHCRADASSSAVTSLSKEHHGNPRILENRLSLPVIAAPLFIISHPPLTLAQCLAGVIGAFPALNARPKEQLDDWLAELTGEARRRAGRRPIAPHRAVCREPDRARQ